ncbi:hypothetical protein [Qipengyuania zhejiangensis]|uniref:hypothetical protein n=1 Tax=Qipengyuania zhejiangensis TaxID=3077782 RepID=UPI002D7719D3|nr:hypothetical protein [Qipengyuania sp. Z2]
MLIKLAALGALGFAGYKYFEKNQAKPAFARNQGDAQIRDAGPESMRDETNRDWAKTDEESDQSFPASDPPANY